MVTLADGSKLLVKQERHNHKGEAAGEFLGEGRIQQLLQKFSELNHLSDFLPKLLHFDEDNSIVVFRYLEDYCDLMDLYQKENDFHPPNFYSNWNSSWKYPPRYFYASRISRFLPAKFK